eukprot:COSAG01_NODE_75259_length_197_cov_62.755102_1_plen_21_part_01
MYLVFFVALLTFSFMFVYLMV